MKPAILVSACLLGEPCRYDGGSNYKENIELLKAVAHVIPCCPEQEGGLPTPRIPAERRGAAVVTKDGKDVTDAFVTGAEIALQKAIQSGCGSAVLKSKSPSCGYGKIYDGSFSKRLIEGNGVTAGKLAAAGIAVFSEHDIDSLIERLKAE